MPIDHRGAALSANFITAPITVDGRALRPLSAASFSILKRTGNAFITGSEDPDRKLAAAMEFIFVHGAPLAEVIAATSLPTARQAQRFHECSFEEFMAVSPEERTELIKDAMLAKFRAAVLEYNAEIPLELEADAADAIAAQAEAAGAAIVDPKPPESNEESTDPN